jgi:hypothetical protein
VAEFASGEYEADDLIGSLAARVRREGLRVTIVTRDKDLSQLIGPGDVYWDYGGGTEYRYEEIAARFGVAPERMADYLALTGDAVDNVPGVPGVGPKTAAALLGVFASLEELYADLEAVAQLPLRGALRLRERLRLHRDAAYRARELTRICCEAPLDGGREVVRRRSPDLAALAAFCRQHGFGSSLGGLLHPDLAPAAFVDQLAREQVARAPGLAGLALQLQAVGAVLIRLVGHELLHIHRLGIFVVAERYGGGVGGRNMRQGRRGARNAGGGHGQRARGQCQVLQRIAARKDVAHRSLLT